MYKEFSYFFTYRERKKGGKNDTKSRYKTSSVEKKTDEKVTRHFKTSLDSVAKAEKLSHSSSRSDHNTSTSNSETGSDSSDSDTENKTLLPGGWTLEELQNSPLKTFVPINQQRDSQCFKDQYEEAKRRQQRRLDRMAQKGTTTNKKTRKPQKKKRKSKKKSVKKVS